MSLLALSSEMPVKRKYHSVLILVIQILAPVMLCGAQEMALPPWDAVLSGWRSLDSGRLTITLDGRRISENEDGTEKTWRFCGKAIITWLGDASLVSIVAPDDRELDYEPDQTVSWELGAYAIGPDYLEHLDDRGRLEVTARSSEPLQGDARWVHVRGAILAEDVWSDVFDVLDPLHNRVAPDDEDRRYFACSQLRVGDCLLDWQRFRFWPKLAERWQEGRVLEHAARSMQVQFPITGEEWEGEDTFVGYKTIGYAAFKLERRDDDWIIVANRYRYLEMGSEYEGWTKWIPIEWVSFVIDERRIWLPASYGSTVYQWSALNAIEPEEVHIDSIHAKTMVYIDQSDELE